MLGPNQTRSDGTGVGASVEVLVVLRGGAGIVVSVGLGGLVGRGVPSTICGMLQAVAASISNMISLRGIMYCGPL